MLAPKDLPKEFLEWNRQQGAPFGHHRRILRTMRRFYSEAFWQRLQGPFSLQGNNTTRKYEYPWAYFAAELNSPKRIVDIGGSLSGFQFVLSKEGHEVVNVDPGMEAHGVGWLCDEANIKKLNSWFGTNVTLKNTTIGNAGLQSDYYDLFFSISVIEHLTEADLNDVLTNAYRCLKSGGRFVITLDLFLNLHPFTCRITNEFGCNQNVFEMVQKSGLKLAAGNREQLFGFPEFSAGKILENLENFLIGVYPVLTQCIVLEKP